MKMLGAAAVLLLVPVPARSQCAPDSVGPPGSQPYFGASVDVSGDFAIVGALGESPLAGGYTILRRVAGSWTVQLTSGGFPGQITGGAAAISVQGEQVFAAGGMPFTSAVYGGVWVAARVQQGWWLTKVIESQASESPGTAVVVDGTQLLASAPNANGGAGEVRHYELSLDSFQSHIQHVLVGTFSVAGSQPGDQFGRSLARDGDVLAVGAPIADASGVQNAGRVHVARWSGSAWVLEATLESSTPTPGGQFGWAVDVVGDTLVVGARAEPGAAGNSHGAAHVFERQSGSWVHVQRLVSHSAPNTAYGFGWALGIEGDRLFVSAPAFAGGLSPWMPRVDVFRRTGPGQVWLANGTLQMSDGQFGASLSVDGTRLLVGASTVQPSGRVFHYEHHDCDADGTIDACQIASAPALDCDLDGALDACEIAAGIETDCNADGIPDGCQCGPLHFVLQPQPVNVTPGQTIELSVEACGPPSIAYQWRRDGIALANGGGVSGADTGDLVITGATYVDTGTYTCDVSNPCAMLTSNAVEVEVLAGTGLCSIGGWQDSGWAGLGSGFIGPPGPPVRVLALETYDAGLGGGPSLFAAGEFQASGAFGVLRIARWNGTAWLPVGVTSGGANGPVHALEVYDRDGPGPFAAELYAGGIFTQVYGQPASSIARWNGTSWAAVGAGVGGIVECLLAHDPDAGGPAAPSLYAGGGGLAQGNVMRWNGTTWSATNGPVQHVYDLAFFDDGGGAELYAGTSVGLMRYNGAGWSSVGTLNGDVRALAVYDRDGGGPQAPALYLGGSFTQSSPSTGLTWRIASWNGLQFSPITVGFDASVEALAVVPEGAGSVLAVGGGFTNGGSFGANRVAKWNGSSWVALGTGLQGPAGQSVAAYALHAFDPDGAGPLAPALHVGGAFAQAGATPALHVARVTPPSAAICPCGNWGQPSRGCGNSVNPAGTTLVAYGAPSLAADSVVLVASGMPSTALSIPTQATSVIAPVVFGDGVRCIGGALLRLYVKNAVGGVVTSPGPGDAPISVRSAALGDTIPVGAARYYHVYYRDPAPTCTAATFNVTSAVAIGWLP